MNYFNLKPFMALVLTIFLKICTLFIVIIMINLKFDNKINV